MYDRCTRLEADCQAQIAQAPTEIDVLAVHEEALVPTTESLKVAATDCDAGTGNPVWLGYTFVGAAVTNEIFCECVQARHPMEEQCLG
jgi:hypothetical protein